MITLTSLSKIYRTDEIGNGSTGKRESDRRPRRISKHYGAVRMWQIYFVEYYGTA